MSRTGLNKTQIQRTAQQAVRAVQYSYSGPLPHPEILEHYDRVVPGGAERIFAQFENQAFHRQAIEAKVISSNVFCQRLGSISALLLGILAISGGIFLIHEGKHIEGAGTVIASLASLVGVYIYGKQSQASERASKQYPNKS